MKQWMLTIVLGAGLAGTVSAQSDNSHVYENRYKQKQLELLQESGIKLTPVQKDSVAAVNYEVWQQVREIRNQDFHKQGEKFKELENYRVQRLTGALGDAALAKKVSDYFKGLQLKQEQKSRQDSAAFRHS